MHYHSAENCDTVESIYYSICKTYFITQKALQDPVIVQNH